MRVKLINAVTGTEMWVADNRLDEYIAAGNIPAASPEEKPKDEEMPLESRRRKRLTRKDEEK